MRDFSEWSPSTDPFHGDRKVAAFDLDDTLTTDGALESAVVRGLEDAQAAGWSTILVTGRSAGWVDAIAKLLPFDAIVGENGAVLYRWPKGKRARAPREEAAKLYWTPQGYASQPPGGTRARFDEASRKILARHPGARVASDQSFRLYDLAIDFAEEVDPPLPLSEAEEIRRDFEALGATAKVSSIHVNGWWGAFTKVDGLRKLVEELGGLSLEKHVLYGGDSPNDGPLFEAAGLSVGVANVRRFLGSPGFREPLFVTREEGGRGALEILQALSRRKR
jgi:HAD superfamily hydrolase (TIGR01484 family)